MLEPRDREILTKFIEAATTAVIDVLDYKFPKQVEFILDPARLKALWCTRRAAKSYTDGLAMVDCALKNPGCNVLFIGLTRLEAKGIIWKDILKVINLKHGLNMSFNNQEITATFPNGSVIWVTGIDSSEDEMNKTLGRKYKRVVLDEASLYSVDVRRAVYGLLKPATIDEGGDIILSGTSSNITQGLFFDITTNREPGWKLYQWTALDNPYVAKQWQEELDDIAKNRPAFMETSLFKQWYLNQWVIDEEARVYKFSRDRNFVQNKPALTGDWHYVLGLDLAHSPDSTAFVVGAYNDSDSVLYLVEAFAATKMDITDVAIKVKELEKKYVFEVKVVDGANKQAVAELNNRHGLALLAADKTGKTDFIKLMNDEFIQGKIKLLPATCGTEQAPLLTQEYEKLVWITDSSGKVIEPRKENPNIHNDLSDAALYLWRYCYQYILDHKEPFEDMGVQSVWEKKHMDRLAQQVKAAQNPNDIDIAWKSEFKDTDFNDDEAL